MFVLRGEGPAAISIVNVLPAGLLACIIDLPVQLVPQLAATTIFRSVQRVLISMTAVPYCCFLQVWSAPFSW